MPFENSVIFNAADAPAANMSQTPTDQAITWKAARRVIREVYATSRARARRLSAERAQPRREDRAARAHAPTLSVCCNTRDNAEILCYALSLLRPVADEIIVAVDVDVSGDDLARYAAVADRLYRVPPIDCIEVSLPWLHAVCQGDWILRLDSDELPSQGLVDTLPELIGDPRVTHYLIPRRWLWPTAAQGLAGPPWWPDHQVRLVRNLPAVLRFPSYPHGPFSVLGGSRRLSTPLYHADLILLSTEQRREKVARNDAANPGLLVSGKPLNEAYYLPEAQPVKPVMAVSEPDRTLIQAWLAGGSRPQPAPADAIRSELVRGEELFALWARRTVGPEFYRARLSLLGPPPPLRPGERTNLEVQVTNLGNDTWPRGPGGMPAIHLSYSWLDPFGAVVLRDGSRTPFTSDVAPSETVVESVTVLAPAQPGTYRLALDVVHETERWFGCVREIPIDVS